MVISINILPNEILVVIFKFIGCMNFIEKEIPNYMKVCKHWRHIIQNMVNIFNISKIPIIKSPNVAGNSLGMMLRLFPNIERLYMPYSKNIIYSPLESDCMGCFFTQISQCLSKLIFLDMGNYPYCYEDISILAESCPKISYLILNQISDICATLLPSSLTHLATRALKYKDDDDTDKFTNQGIQNISDRCRNLKYLILRGKAILSDDGIKYLAGCTKLKRITIRNQLMNVSDESVTALVNNCQLKVVDFIGSPRLPEKVLIALSHCNNLTMVTLNNNNDHDENFADPNFELIKNPRNLALAVVQVLKSNRNLNMINIGGHKCDFIVLREVILNFRQLKYFRYLHPDAPNNNFRYNVTYQRNVNNNWMPPTVGI